MKYECVFFSAKMHIGPTVGLGDFGREAAVDQIYLAGPPVPLTRRWDFAKRWTEGFECRRPTCWRENTASVDSEDSNMWIHV